MLATTWRSATIDLHEPGSDSNARDPRQGAAPPAAAITSSSWAKAKDRIVGLLSLPATTPAPVVIFAARLGLHQGDPSRWAGRWVARGFAVLSIDGPGQGEASRWSTIRPDYDVAVSVIDWIESRSASTPPNCRRRHVARRLLRTAGGCVRASDCATVGNCGPYDWAECLDIIPQVTRRRSSTTRAHRPKPEPGDAADDLGRRRPNDHAPLLIVHGERDPLIPWEQGKRIVDEASGQPSSFWSRAATTASTTFPSSPAPSSSTGSATNYGRTVADSGGMLNVPRHIVKTEHIGDARGALRVLRDLGRFVRADGLRLPEGEGPFPIILLGFGQRRRERCAGTGSAWPTAATSSMPWSRPGYACAWLRYRTEVELGYNDGGALVRDIRRAGRCSTGARSSTRTRSPRSTS